MTRVLFVDDDAEVGATTAAYLERRGVDVDLSDTSAGAKAALERRDYHVALVDVQLGSENGLDLCRWMVEHRPQLPVILVTAFGNLELAIEAIRAGAYDFVNKPVDFQLLDHAVKRAAAHSDLHRLLARYESDRVSPGEVGMVGDSRVMRAMIDLITRAADSDASVLVTGESGTGKELVARALHDQSPRHRQPFVALNCAAVPPNLLEAELFGHVKGAFTDARSAKEGLLRAADGGTLFLDELGEMPVEMQVKLLRALQERTVRPVGSSSEVSFDTRLVAATNRDIESEVEAGDFREDLYYRINVIRIRVPPLRSRGSDVLLLARHFLKVAAGRSNKEMNDIAPAAAERLLEYDWPGNVRELENVIERAVALSRFDQLMLEDLPEKIRNHRSEQIHFGGDDPEELMTLAELEERYLRRVLKVTAGNKTQAARILGLDRRTLYRKLERYESQEDES